MTNYLSERIELVILQVSFRYCCGRGIVLLIIFFLAAARQFLLMGRFVLFTNRPGRLIIDLFYWLIIFSCDIWQQLPVHKVILKVS